MAHPDLDALVEDERIDELVQVVTAQEIAETWMRYQRQEQEADWWAVSLWMSDTWWMDEARVRDGILRLVDLAVSEEDYSIISAAVLEVFATDDESRLHWIERQAASSEDFRQAMRDMWVWRLPDRAFRRVERAAGVELADPAPDRRARRLGEDWPPTPTA
ncbi:MAG TPA: hypothetical protein VFI47_04005 [Acidimicrobiales bacterium]|nr:hypothetical protein [Acidimicrobiales bacterium]